MEKIIVGGCSFTDPNYKSILYPQYNHTVTWTDFLNGEVKNVARSGNGNPTIINDVLESIYNDKPDRVIISLSDWARYSIRGYNINPLFILYETISENSDSPKMNREVDRQLNLMPSNYKIQAKVDRQLNLITPSNYKIQDRESFIIDGINSNIINSIRDTTLALYTLAVVCEDLRIKLHIFQMIYSFNPPRKYAYIQHKFEYKLLKSELFMDLFDTKSDLIGFPWFKNAGGIVAQTILTSEDVVGKLDTHPNALGHEKIGRWFNETYTNYEI